MDPNNFMSGRKKAGGIIGEYRFEIHIPNFTIQILYQGSTSGTALRSRKFGTVPVPCRPLYCITLFAGNLINF